MRMLYEICVGKQAWDLAQLGAARLTSWLHLRLTSTSSTQETAACHSWVRHYAECLGDPDSCAIYEWDFSCNMVKSMHRKLCCYQCLLPIRQGKCNYHICDTLLHWTATKCDNLHICWHQREARLCKCAWGPGCIIRLLLFSMETALNSVLLFRHLTDKPIQNGCL